MNRPAPYFAYLIWSHLILSTLAIRPGSIEILNVTCEAIDTTFLTIQKCVVTKGKDQRMSWDFSAQLLKERDGLMVHAKLMRKVYKKFQPFLYDDQIDVCDFLDAAKRQFFWGLVYEIAEKFSSINHSCPLDQAFRVKNFAFEGRQFRLIPLPKGQYMLDFIASTFNMPRFRIQLFCAKT